VSEKPGEAPDPAPAVLDLSRALGRLLGNKDLLAWMVHQFRDEAPKGIKDLGDAIERKDLPAVAYAAHRLRGQALALEALALAGALDGIEQGAWKGDVAGVESLRRPAEVALDQVLEAVATIPPPPASSAAH